MTIILVLILYILLAFLHFNVFLSYWTVAHPNAKYSGFSNEIISTVAAFGWPFSLLPYYILCSNHGIQPYLHYFKGDHEND